MKGSQVDPINLDLDEEEEVDIQAKLEEARKRELLQQAKITKSPFQLCLAAIKSTVKGERLTKNRVVNKAIIEYFQKEVKMNISCQFFQARPEPDYEDNAINPKQLILYGVDFLSTKMIQDRFNCVDASIFQIKWIDSSTCKLVFQTEAEAKIVLERQLADISVFTMKRDSQTEQLQGWFALKGYSIFSFDRSLFVRYSTEKENNIEKGELNKYNDFDKARNQLIHYLFNKFNATKAYQQAILEIQREGQMQFRVRQRNSFPNRRRNERRYQRGSDQRDRTREKNRRHQFPRDENDNNNGGIQRRRMNRERRQYQPERFEGKFNRQGNYDNRRGEHYGGYQSNNRDRMGAPRVNNAYYDCNDIDEDLSFEFRQEEQAQHHGQDQDLNLQVNNSFQFQKQKAPRLNGSLLTDKQDLSFIVGSANNNNILADQDLSLIMGNPNNQSVEARNNQRAEMSFVFEEPKKNVEEQNYSLVYAEDNKGEKSGVQEDQDFSMIFGQEQEVSPIHGFNSSFVMNKQKERNRGSQNNKDSKTQFLDFEKPVNIKKTQIVLDDDDGY